MTMTSADFSINGTEVPIATGLAVSSTYGSTVSLALLDVSGAAAIDWAVLGVSGTDIAVPTVSKTGVPLGATASFAIPSDNGKGFGVSYDVRCRVTDGNGDRVESHGIVGVPNAGGAVPLAAGEEIARHPTLGWTVFVNQMAMGFPHTTWSATTVDATITTAATVNIPTGEVVRVASIWSAYDATAGHRLFREAVAYYHGVAGVATSLGSEVVVIDHEDDASWEATFTPSGSDVLIRYRGDATNATSWRGYVYTTKPGN